MSRHPMSGPAGRASVIGRLLLPLLLAVAAPALADEAEEAAARLESELRALDQDPSLADLAGSDRYRARQAVAALLAAKSRDREHALYIAERRVETARVAAEAELARRQIAQLDREHDRILLQASRAEAERARREAERLRLQSLAQQEEAERIRLLMADDQLARDEALGRAEAAGAEAAQARRLAAARAREAELARREAELAASIGADSGTGTMPPVARRGDGEVITLAGDAFASGSASLTGAARASLRRVAEHLGRTSGAVRIVGYTDSQGAAEANRTLSQRRADAVLRALRDAGVDASRLSAEGQGAEAPVADNATAEGRARNRRVEIVVADG